MPPENLRKDYVVCDRCGKRFEVAHVPPLCPVCGSAGRPPAAKEPFAVTDRFRLAAKHAKGGS